MKKKSIILLFMCLNKANLYPMKINDSKDPLESRSSTLAYSTELNVSTDFNFSPISSPRVNLETPKKEKNCFCRYLKTLYCLCCCKKKPDNRLIAHYETIQ